LENSLQTSIYRRQHDELERLVMVLISQLPEASAARLRACLAQLAGVLRIHLAMEEKNMYPRLLEHPDPMVRAAGIEYRQTMADLEPAFQSYYDAWTEEAIARSRAAFLKETKGLVMVLPNRIALENDKLYAMIDREAIVVT
jgi:hypothetical protein